MKKRLCRREIFSRVGNGSGQLRRAQVLAFFSKLPRCLVGMEACATAHYWARELRALGHEVRLMPAQYVKAYVKRKRCGCASDLQGGCAAPTIASDSLLYNKLTTFKLKVTHRSSFDFAHH